MALDWASFEVVALLAGRLGETAVAAQAGLASLDGFLFMLPYAISVVATARFGNLVRRSRPTLYLPARLLPSLTAPRQLPLRPPQMGMGQTSYRRLKSLVVASFIVEFCCSSCVAVTILLSRHALGYAFTSHEETVRLIGKVCIAVAAYQVFDGLQSVAAGILRATGRQPLAASIHLLCYYGLGVPLAYL